MTSPPAGAAPAPAASREEATGPLPPGLHLPVYGAANLADVLPGVAAALGVTVTRGDVPLDPLGLTGVLAGARRVAVLLVDGLGTEILRAHPDHAPVLAALAAPVGALTAPCPSTTPVSLTSLGTGRPPGAHGVLGFVTDVPGRERTVNHLRWTDDPDPGQWQATPTVFEQAAAAGVTSGVVGPRTFARSGLTRAAYRGAEYAPACSPGDLVAVMHRCLVAGSPSLAYGYTADLDLTGHLRGVDSAAWRNQLGVVDRLVEQLVDGLPADGALLVTGDHGMLDVPAHARFDIDAVPELAEGVRVVTGEPRARYVHARPGAAADVLAAWRATLDFRAWVVSREEAVDSGVFGPVEPGLAPRIGDVVALARGSWAMVALQREPAPARLAAYHGSLTATELAIPLLVARGTGLG